jgi:hypothetical protein
LQGIGRQKKAKVEKTSTFAEILVVVANAEGGEALKP